MHRIISLNSFLCPLSIYAAPTLLLMLCSLAFLRFASFANALLLQKINFFKKLRCRRNSSFSRCLIARDQSHITGKSSAPEIREKKFNLFF